MPPGGPFVGVGEGKGVGETVGLGSKREGVLALAVSVLATMVPTMEKVRVPVAAKGWQADKINKRKIRERTLRMRMGASLPEKTCLVEGFLCGLIISKGPVRANQLETTCGFAVGNIR
jgi:hypothetical protein